jgi:hypothetical protein
MNPAVLILLRLLGYVTVLETEYNPQVADHLIRWLRTAALRSGLIAPAESLVYEHGHLMFIKMDMEQVRIQERADALAANLQASVHRFLRGSALTAIMSMFIRREFLKFSDVNVEQVLRRLNLETRVYVVPSPTTVTRVQLFGEQKLREWK